MTLKAYERATAILKEKEQLEKELSTIQVNIGLSFGYDKDSYTEIVNKLFQLGQEFNSL